jgi:5-methylcytosine-specific restriction endonuclease McrA
MTEWMSHLAKRQVWVRDRWQCRMPECLCPDGRAIDPALDSTNSPWAPSVDHIVRFADGGNSHHTNLRSAHRECNNRAGNPPQEAARAPGRRDARPVGGLDVASRIGADLASRLRDLAG